MRHHLAPVESLESYRVSEDLLPRLDGVLELAADGSRLEQAWLNASRLDGLLARDTWVQRNPSLRRQIAEANELSPIELSEDEVADLIAFLHALTDPAAIDLSHLAPGRVPSGLPVAD